MTPPPACSAAPPSRLTQFPGQRVRLLDAPSLIARAVEEFLRLTSPVQGLARTISRPVTIGESPIPAWK